jgi:hypothetical protein
MNNRGHNTSRREGVRDEEGEEEGGMRWVRGEKGQGSVGDGGTSLLLPVAT